MQMANRLAIFPPRVRPEIFVAVWCAFGAPSASLPGHSDLQPSWLTPPAVAAPPLHGQERPRAESGALPPIAPVRQPSPPSTTPDGAVAPGRSSGMVQQSPPNSFTGFGLNRTDDQTARATAPLGRGDANVRGVDPTFAHHVTQPLASMRAVAPPLQPVSPAVLLWPHRPTQPLASFCHAHAGRADQ